MCQVDNKALQARSKDGKLLIEGGIHHCAIGGGQTVEISMGVTREALTIGVLLFEIMLIAFFCFCRCKKMIEKKITAEIARSREQV
nr:unnamed protein product [Callosobruchus analis]